MSHMMIIISLRGIVHFEYFTEVQTIGGSGRILIGTPFRDDGSVSFRAIEKHAYSATGDLQGRRTPYCAVRNG